MKLKTIAYWTATTLIALETFAGGIVDLTHGRTDVFSGPRVDDVIISLGYPLYVLAILGVCKIPGAITLVVPGFLRLKEWAYAGIVFELSAAAVSHAVCGHRPEVVAPLVLVGLALVSWALRPPSRVLGSRLRIRVIEALRRSNQARPLESRVLTIRVKYIVALIYGSMFQ